MRLIDADLVIDTVNEFKGKNRKTDLGIKLVEEIVSNAPTVEADVVRCKDCIYAKPFNEVWVYPIKDTLVCTHFIGDEEVDENFFCGCAIKKMDEVEE